MGKRIHYPRRENREHVLFWSPGGSRVGRKIVDGEPSKTSYGKDRRQLQPDKLKEYHGKKGLPKYDGKAILRGSTSDLYYSRGSYSRKNIVDLFEKINDIHGNMRARRRALEILEEFENDLEIPRDIRQRAREWYSHEIIKRDLPDLRKLLKKNDQNLEEVKFLEKYLNLAQGKS